MKKKIAKNGYWKIFIIAILLETKKSFVILFKNILKKIRINMHMRIV